MEVFRTSKCASHGHREFTLLAKPSPIPRLGAFLVEYLEGAVARGTKFETGQTIALGWSTLLLCDRADGTLGVQERVLSPETEWTESVDRALVDLWTQKEINASVDLLGELAFPSQDDTIIVTDCGMESSSSTLARLPAEGLPKGFSGWTLSCADEHDHGERMVVPLLALAANLPGLVQLLALPHGTVVFVRYVPTTAALDGPHRIEPHVFRDGRELVPKAGSYLAALHSRGATP
jgi:hypothetical protein